MTRHRQAPDWIDWLAGVWDGLAAKSPSQLKRGFLFHFMLWCLFLGLMMFVIRPYHAVCFVEPSGWFLAPGAWYYFWVPFAWALLVALHFFVVSSLTVDEEAMVLKSRQIRAKSTDFYHMSNIMDRQWDGDDSVVSPFDSRRRTDAFGQPRKQANGDEKRSPRKSSEASSEESAGSADKTTSQQQSTPSRAD